MGRAPGPSDGKHNAASIVCGSIVDDGSFVLVTPEDELGSPSPEGGRTSVTLTRWAVDEGSASLVPGAEVRAVLPVPWKVLVPVGCTADNAILKHRDEAVCPLCQGDGVKWWVVGLADGSAQEHEQPVGPGGGAAGIVAAHLADVRA